MRLKRGKKMMSKRLILRWLKMILITMREMRLTKRMIVNFNISSNFTKSKSLTF
jgi:hypothetical protein